MGNINLAPNLL